MALIEVQTKDGPRKVRVCDYCRTVCIPSGRFCSGRCAGRYWESLSHRHPAPKDADEMEYVSVQHKVTGGDDVPF